MSSNSHEKVIKPGKASRGKYSAPERKIVFTKAPSTGARGGRSGAGNSGANPRARGKVPGYSGSPVPAASQNAGSMPRAQYSSGSGDVPILSERAESALPDIAPPKETFDELEIKSPPTISNLRIKMANLEREMGPGAVQEGINLILAKNSRMRPGFSSSWVIPDAPPNATLIKQYRVEDSTVSLYLLPEGIEALYHIFPAEYAIPEEHMRLVELTRKELVAHYPHSMELSKPDRAREYVKKFGQKYMYRLAKKHRIPLGPTRQEELKQLQKLSKILAKFTAGMGIIETMLTDHYIQDIYVDSPTSDNRVYVVLEGGIDHRLSGKCITNVILSKTDAESLLSRFRYESGRPFSEATPLLECSIGSHNTRVSVIGRPLSPTGTAFALRRHSTEPWTLLRLINLGSISPLAAGIISFLIDGKATILMAGSRGAGKTSLLSACMLEFPRSQRIITIEDTLELPVERLQELDYKVQPMQIQSSLGGFGEMSANDALKIALRLGESALVIGEVRGEEARTLYEAMRAGTAGSSVLGTFHANSAEAVFERIVYDMKIPAKSFAATDVVIIANFVRPKGTHKMKRRVTQVAELDKSTDDGTFRNLLTFDEKKDKLEETDVFHYSSQVIGRIAASWGMSMEEAVQNIIARATIRKIAVDYARKAKMRELLSAEWVQKINSKFWEMLDRQYTTTGTVNYQEMIREFTDWFVRSAKYA